MEKYLMAILVLMPGFLAISTAEKLGKTHTRKSGVSLALEYAVYTVVILLIARTQRDEAFWVLDRAAIRAVEFHGFWVSEVCGIDIGAAG